jgi:hypothetical protein
MAIIFAALVPQLRLILNSWDSKVGASETLQNGRILINHINRNLSTALRITAVSDSSETNGYIEFLDNDANNVRYAVNSTSDIVEFGLIGNPSDLAGPVSQLKFTCYDAFDLSTPITDVNSIRSVKVETTLTNPATLDQDMNFTTQAYIRTNTLPAAGGDISKMSEPWLEFDLTAAVESALVHKSGTKFLCAYRGNRDDGFACFLTVNPADWSVSSGAPLEYDTKSGVQPALGKIDDGNFLCAYQGDRGDGFACILYEWPAGSGILEVGPKLEFDTADCMFPALSHIYTQGDDHYFLCVWTASNEARAIVLRATIIPFVMMQLATEGIGSTFPAAFVPRATLAKIDDTHYLCGYDGENGNAHPAAVVLTVNPADWSITPGTHFDFLGAVGDTLELGKVDDTHYLCSYWSDGDGLATVLTVNPADWTITKTPGPDLFIDLMGTINHPLCRIDNMNFLSAYPASETGGGRAVVLTVNTGDWSISKNTFLDFEPTNSVEPSLCQIDPAHYLCAYSGVDSDGFAGVLELGTGEGILP